ncbi:NBS-LRR resistance protein [Trifolium medium]|uniref:NBS-LRR resistance protein n=1 Tax=Trifolium medium TaxID=97028 RepID=A0A392LZE6_9FABA|nr:NBS-LRR resistance protein [Trifolium medium]
MEFGLNQEKWNKLKSVLLCGSKGSSILVSTRDKDVAALMGTCQAHQLSCLSEHECWLLFKHYAFGYDKEQQTELVTIGKEIVKKCGGLPLAAQALGGLMRSRNGEKEWLEIKNSSLWSLPNENSILPALRLSYFHLTPTLKQCFTFCAMFPKDTEIMKEDLIHLWVANGFLSSRVNLEIEDVGNMVWNELCQKSFFQDIKTVNDSGDISFKLHDLVHDLAQSIIGSECLILENTNITDLSRSTHHIGLVSATPSLFGELAFTRVESLRTLFQIGFDTTRFSDCFPTSTRVLRTNSSNLSSLTSLIHLRYLELFDLHDIKTIPDSIYSLRNLEILKLKHFSKLRCLPEHLTCLQNLRHLVIQNCDALSRVFPNIGKLSSLRTLSKYIVRLDIGYSLAELHDLKLGGDLSIRCLENVGSLSEAREANLMDKKELQEICLSWKNSGKNKTPAISPEEVLEVLQPHSNLKILKIHGYDGLWLPSWLQIQSSLVVLRLSHCKNCVRLPSLGRLPSLKKLQLWHMDSVRYVDDEESNDGMEVRSFPSLEELLLGNLPNLEQLLKVETGEIFLRLSKLAIVGCPKLGLPCLPSFKELIVDGCNNELLGSISSFYGLTTLELYRGEGVTSFPKGMLRNLTCLRTLEISDFPKVKALPNEPFNLALEHLGIHHCCELESLPEQMWEGLQSLRTLEIAFCEGLRCLPEGIRHLTSLEVLTVYGCPTVEERCKEGIGEDWYKIEHVPKLSIN